MRAGINVRPVAIDKSVIRKGVDCRTGAANVALAWGLVLVFVSDALLESVGTPDGFNG